MEVMTIGKDLINAQRELNVISNEFLVRKRAFSTPEGPRLSEDRPREAAGSLVITHTKVLVPSIITLDNLEKIFDDLLEEIKLLNTEKKHDPCNLEAIRMCGAKDSSDVSASGGFWRYFFALSHELF